MIIIAGILPLIHTHIILSNVVFCIMSCYFAVFYVLNLCSTWSSTGSSDAICQALTYHILLSSELLTLGMAKLSTRDYFIESSLICVNMLLILIFDFRNCLS